MTSFGEQFLVSPELFPGRIAGEAWGNETLVLALPGGPYQVSGLSVTQRQSLVQRYGDLAGVAGDAAFEFLIQRAPSSDFRELDTRGWEYSLDLDAGESTVAIAGMRLMARLELARARAAIWTPIDEVEEFWGIVENVLRPLVALRLVAAGGLLVHSAAVSLDGAGLLFVGPSGAGKSTVSQLALAAGHPVLSDDLNAIVRCGDGLMLVPLPFTGDLEPSQTSRLAVPLRAIVRLEKGTGEWLAPMPRAEAASLLVRSAPYINHDRHRLPLLLDRAGELVSIVKRDVLTFRRDADIWPILRAL